MSSGKFGYQAGLCLLLSLILLPAYHVSTFAGDRPDGGDCDDMRCLALSEPAVNPALVEEFPLSDHKPVMATYSGMKIASWNVLNKHFTHRSNAMVSQGLFHLNSSQ